jgi:hypothetical protein
MSKQDVIVNLLSSVLANDNPTSRNLFDAMEQSERGLFTGGVDGVGKELYALKNKGIVENGLSQIIDGRTYLTWRVAAKKKTEQSAQEIAAAPEPTGSILFLLDPDNAFEMSVISMVSSVREINAISALKIERKQEKIDTLKRIGSLMNDDIEFVLDDIAADLSKFDDL